MHSLISKSLSFAEASGLTPVNLAIIAITLAIFWLAPSLFRKTLCLAHSAMGLLERHPVAAIILVSLIPLAARALLLPEHPIPVPRIHDEFSYLVAADTFAHGKVTNPSHPLFEFFETYHVLPYPTYMSKYPPAQGLILAAGQVLFGHPWWGAFLSTGIMVGSVCWMLQGWVPGRWAFLGATAAALQFGIGHAWMNSYWGGQPAAIGACLTLGAIARLLQFRNSKPHPIRNALLFAFGVVLMLNSRPWEGVAIILPVGIAGIVWLLKPTGLFERIRTVALPATGLLTVAALAMLYYNWRGTGSPLSMPYTVIHKTYSVAPLFVWQKRTPDPEYRHAVMKRFYLGTEPHYQNADTLTTLHGWASLEPGRLRMAKDLLFGNFFLFLCLPVIFFHPRKPVQLLLITLAIFMVFLALESWNQIHYFGPVVGLAAALKMFSLRRLSTLTFHQRRIGQALTAAVILCSALNLAQDAMVFPNQDAFSHDRAALQRQLESAPGAQVVLVRYSETHPPVQEWVYNKANIDGSKVIWARYISEQENRKLFDYFKGRNFWLLEPDSSLRLKPLDSATTEQSVIGPVSLSTEPAPKQNTKIQWP